MLIPNGKAKTGGMSDPMSHVIDTVGWVTATVLTAGVAVQLLVPPDGQLGASASVVSTAGEVSSGEMPTIAGVSGSVAAGPRVLHATPRSPSPVISRRA